MVKYIHGSGKAKKVYVETSSNAVPSQHLRVLPGNKKQRRKLVSQLKKGIRDSIQENVNVFFDDKGGRPRFLKEHMVTIANINRLEGGSRLRGLDDFLEEHIEFEKISHGKYQAVLRHPTKNLVAVIGNVRVGKDPNHLMMSRSVWPIASTFKWSAKPGRRGD